MIFKNDKARKDYLDTWRKWPVLVTVPELNLTVHEKALPDGSRILAFDYGEQELHGFKFNVHHKLLVAPGQIVTNRITSTTELANHLKNFKEGI